MRDYAADGARAVLFLVRRKRGLRALGGQWHSPGEGVVSRKGPRAYSNPFLSPRLALGSKWIRMGQGRVHKNALAVFVYRCLLLRRAFGEALVYRKERDEFSVRAFLVPLAGTGNRDGDKFLLDRPEVKGKIPVPGGGCAGSGVCPEASGSEKAVLITACHCGGRLP